MHFAELIMNVFGIIILAALGIEFILNMVSNLLNLRAINPALPTAAEGIYKEEDYRKSQRYLRESTRFGLIRSVFNLAVLLAFWFSGGFNYFDQIIRGWGLAPILSGLIYVGVLLLIYSILMLPFSIYATFVIEQRFGFNKTSPRTFMLDLVKGVLLAAILGGILLAGILALFEYAGTYAWLYCWAAVTLVSLIMLYVAPNWIMPLFNKFTPMAPGDLREAILSYAKSVGFPIKNISVMDGSKRSTKSNAFFTGFGKNKRIALFDTLIARHSVPELVAVLAHEVGHYKKKHILQGFIISFIHTGVLFYLLSLVLSSPGLYQAFYMDKISIYAGLIFFGLLYTPVELVLSIVMNAISRKHEYEADRFAAETTPDPQNLIDSLKKLTTTNLSNLTPHPFYVFLNYSHPPILQRIKAIQNQSSKVKESATGLSGGQN
jgi:STE24 endopeptidase